ncbi:MULTISPECIES: S28 family serine protease [unclassified Streptomyces]|uniref:S28 family serine protease n=1 Tax=unclassified Streptomyces TaxID=2593676 RepID=UPI00074A3A6D|nr:MULTISPECIES: S28 family serine protease [unclassified Streptomyces]KUL60001.1 aminopeptidase [Streptomyces sp. NRRL S-1521]THC48982.1 aminopeptidase [Streptomyces sp. A1499]
MRNKGISALACAGLMAGAAVLGGAAPATAQAATVARAADTAAGTAKDTTADIRARLEKLPGMKVVSVADREGHPLYSLTYRQPVDHRRPHGATFTQRATLWHKSTAKPTVLYTGGYTLAGGTASLTRLLDANQVSVEHRYFGESRPEGPAGDDWSKLTVQQEAADEHRLTRALRTIEKGKWLGTGASKGGMTATYHERFHPGDLDAVVAFVAPNDADNRDDSGYERFFATVGTQECRDALNAVQREMLVRRDTLLPRFEKEAKAEGSTFDQTLGTTDRAYEFAVLDQVWNFWQSGTAAACPTVPDAKKATDDELYDWSKGHGFSVYRDQELGANGSGPYYRQAATQLGWADLRFSHLKDVRRHPDVYQPNSVLPKAMRGTYNNKTIADVDRWVKKRGQRMMFIYGQNDPWSAERFTPSRHDSYRYEVPGANHGASIAKLPEPQQSKAIATIKRWAGVK